MALDLKTWGVGKLLKSQEKYWIRDSMHESTIKDAKLNNSPDDFSMYDNKFCYSNIKYQAYQYCPSYNS